MNRIKSENYFHAEPEKLNCAQSILKGFQNEFGIDDSTIAQFRAWGGGRVEGGTCGALFAANYLLEKRGLPKINAEFAKRTGAERCIDIKKENKTPCVTCVKIADEIIERIISESK